MSRRQPVGTVYLLHFDQPVSDQPGITVDESSRILKVVGASRRLRNRMGAGSVVGVALGGALLLVFRRTWRFGRYELTRVGCLGDEILGESGAGSTVRGRGEADVSLRTGPASSGEASRMV